MTENDYWYNRSSQDRIYGDLQHEAVLIPLVQQQEYNLVSLLKPKIFIDGTQWCVLYGENLIEGIAGFGETAHKAVLAFNAAFHAPLKQTQPA